jgi:hypothetical protein
VNPEEIADHFRSLARNPHRPDGLNVLLDLSEESSPPETKDVREATHHMNKLLPDVCFGACAIVACSDALYGMMRMFEVCASKYFSVTRLFRGIAKAEEWLELHNWKSSS